MSLQELAILKRWHLLHRQNRPVEVRTWDMVLTAWLVGWLGLPAELLLWQLHGLAACTALLLAPRAYVWLRTRLHRSGRLRCDWLDVARHAARMRGT
jgi:hypothetical protein